MSLSAIGYREGSGAREAAGQQLVEYIFGIAKFRNDSSIHSDLPSFPTSGTKGNISNFNVDLGERDQYNSEKQRILLWFSNRKRKC